MLCDGFDACRSVFGDEGEAPFHTSQRKGEVLMEDRPDVKGENFKTSIAIIVRRYGQAHGEHAALGSPKCEAFGSSSDARGLTIDL